MMKKYKVPAIVLGMTANGLGVVRSLARAGVRVYALDSYAARPGMSTRYATCLACPDVQKDPLGFKDFLEGLLKKIGGTAVLLPTSDAHNEFINAYRDTLDPGLKFAMTAKPVMDRILDKKGQYQLAIEAGVPMPETFFPKDAVEAKAIAPRMNYPVILKGLTTGPWRRKFGDKKAVIVNNAAELVSVYQDIHDLAHIEPIVQEIVKGDDTRHYKICVYMDREGRPLLTFTLRKLRQYPCDFGIGCSVESIWEPKVAELGLKFFNKINYYGVGSIEFKKDTRDEQWKMIELNPRLWAQNSLPDFCGQNFSMTAYREILGEKLEPKTAFQEGVKWIAFDEDRTSFKGYHAQGRMTWGAWLKSILTGKRIWATWVWDDPMPFLKAVKFGFLPFEKVFLRLKKLCS